MNCWITIFEIEIKHLRIKLEQILIQYTKTPWFYKLGKSLKIEKKQKCNQNVWTEARRVRAETSTAINQSNNHSNYQSIDQSINQSNNQSINQSIN